MSYRLVSNYDVSKSYYISIKNMAGDVIELGTDQGDTIKNVKMFLSPLINVPYRYLVFIDNLADPDKDVKPIRDNMIVQSNLELNLIIRDPVYDELYHLPEHPEDILKLAEELQYLVRIGKDIGEEIDHFIDGWHDNIMTNTNLSVDYKIDLRDRAINAIENISDSQKEYIRGRLGVEHEEDEDFDYEPSASDYYY